MGELPLSGLDWFFHFIFKPYGPVGPYLGGCQGPPIPLNGGTYKLFS